MPELNERFFSRLSNVQKSPPVTGELEGTSSGGGDIKKIPMVRRTVVARMRSNSIAIVKVRRREKRSDVIILTASMSGFT